MTPEQRKASEDIDALVEQAERDGFVTFVGPGEVGAEASPDGSYHCPCGWSRVILDDETLVDARRAHEGTAIHALALRGEA